MGDKITATTNQDAAIERPTMLLRRLRQTRLLLTISETMVAAADETDVVAAVGTLAETMLGAAFSQVAQCEPRGVRYDTPGGTSIRMASRSPVPDPTAELPGPEALRTGQPLLFADESSAHARFPQLENESTFPVHGARAYLPLIADEHPLGWITLGWQLPQLLDGDVAALLAVLGDATSRALQRAKVLDSASEASNTLQAAMLSILPTVPGLELAARYNPASQGEQVGGDWYDALVADGSTMLVIGDVAGHDVAAAAQMGHLRSVLRGFAVDRAEAPSALLGRLDRANLALGSETVATALVARLDLLGPNQGATITWSSAGHYAPVIVHPGGGVHQLGGESDLLLGVDGDAPRYDHIDSIPAGGTLLLFTDGLVELRGHAMAERLETLLVAASQVAGEPLDVLLDAVLAAMAHPRDLDDVAVLAARPVLAP